MTCKKHGGLLMKNLTVQVVIFQELLSCVSLCHKDFKKHLLIKVSIKKWSEYIFRQLKLHHYKISKTGISLEITLKCLVVSLVLSLTTTPFVFISVGALSVCGFAIVPGMYILLCPQEEEVYSAPERYTKIYSAQIYIFSSTII